VARPRIITARSMGLQFRPNHQNMAPLTHVVGHYSAGARAPNWKVGVQRALSFHRDHLNRKWAGIGYHYLISDDGAIVCCRPVVWQGSHVLAQNRGKVGVNMPGNVGDRPTVRQARSFNWLLHHAHTGEMPRPHRTARNLGGLPIVGHNDLMPTSCPGLFKGMYKRGGNPWPEDDQRESLMPDDMMPEELGPEDDLLELTPEDEEVAEELARKSPEEAAREDEEATGPDPEEAEADVDPDDEGELPEADEEFDEDLGDVAAEAE
jgi:hypothetical protein